jgi:ABC-type transport system involved in multi-copper enzyme maturation permease subunit
MSKFFTQLLNDYRINQKSILNPIIIFLVIDFLAIITFFIVKSKLGLDYQDFVSLDIHTDGADLSMFSESFWYLIGMAILGFAGFVMVLVALSIGNQSLNMEKFRKCEIFYRSQPVSIWSYSFSKYLIAVLAPIVVLFIVGVFNLVLVVPFVNQIIRFDFIDAISGLLVSFLLYSRSIIVVGSIGFLVSGIFKEKAFLKLIIILVSIQLIIVFAHFSLDTPLFDMTQYLVKLVNPLNGLKEMVDVENLESIMDFRQVFNLRILLFNWHSALQIIASAVFFVLGTFIYSRKEVN